MANTRSTEIPSSTQVNDYMKRLQRVQAEIDRRPWGTKKRIAFDKHIMPTRVSGVLLVREVNEEYLSMIEQWLAENPALQPIEVK